MAAKAQNVIANVLADYGDQIANVLDSKDASQLFQRGGALLGNVSKMYAKYSMVGALISMIGTLFFWCFLGTLLYFGYRLLQNNPSARNDLQQAGQQVTNAVTGKANQVAPMNSQRTGDGAIRPASAGGSDYESENDYNFSDDEPGRGFGPKSSTARRGARMEPVPEGQAY